MFVILISTVPEKLNKIALKTKEEINFWYIFQNSEKFSLENFKFHKAVLDFFTNYFVSQKVFEFFFIKKHLIVYNLSFKIGANVNFVKINVGNPMLLISEIFRCD